MCKMPGHFTIITNTKKIKFQLINMLQFGIWLAYKSRGQDFCFLFYMHTTISEDNVQRILKDRRRCPTPAISRYTFSGGRRKIIRRASDKQSNIFVDIFSTRLLMAVILLLILSCLDAFLTLALIEKGRVVEANPLMAFFLNSGVLHFSLIKFLITAVALIVLCLFKNVRITRIALPAVINIYLAVIIYEIYLYMI